jgi:HAD superfamily hydrolase (TIGR01490 family)
VPHERADSGALAVFDLDGTITRRDSFMPFIWSCLWRRPWRLPRLLALPPLTLGFLFHRDRGRFKGSLLRATLGGLPRAYLEHCAAQFVPRLLQHGVFAEAQRAIAMHRLQGDRLLLLSASVDLYVPMIGRALGFEQTICSQVSWRGDGRLDGRLRSANCRGEEKRRCLQAVIARSRPSLVYAYGNSRADLPHLRLAQQAYFINGPDSLLQSSPGIQALRWSQRS